MKPALSVIIVTFNHEREIGECLPAIYERSSARPLEIFVVDNSSDDGTVAAVNKCKLLYDSKDFRIEFVQNRDNKGYTLAVNQALNEASGEFILMLNPDTIVQKESIDLMLQFLRDKPDTGAVAPQLLFPDGRIQPSCRRFPRYRFIVFEMMGLNRLFPTSSIFNGWKMGDFDHRSLKTVPQPQGSCLMLPRKVLEEVGNLDERFFLFFSDVDLCKRIWRSGRKIYFYPAAKVIHQRGSSIYRNRAASTWRSHRDFIRYFLKWSGLPVRWISNILGIPLLLKLGVIRWGLYRLSKSSSKNAPP
ncbi:MAG: glycosyltransferase family 2 protein [bacterium]